MLFVLSLIYVPDIVSAVLIEAWPIFLIFVLRQKESEYHFPSSTLLLFILSFVAVGLIVSSSLVVGENEGTSIISYLLGILLLAAANLTYSQGGVRVLQSQKIIPLLKNKAPDSNDEVAAFQLLRAFSLLGVSILCFLIYLTLRVFNISGIFSTSISIPGLIAIAAGGVLINSVGSLIFHRGIMKAKNLKVVIVSYMTPAVSVIYLLLFYFFHNLLLPSNTLKLESVNWGLFLGGLILLVGCFIASAYRKSVPKISEY